MTELDPRQRRPHLHIAPWYADKGVLSPILWFAGLGSIVFALLAGSAVLEYVNSIDLESRLGRCSAEPIPDCATVSPAVVLSSSPSEVTVSSDGLKLLVVRASGIAGSRFRPGQQVEVISASGPIAELKGPEGLLFTRYYEPPNPFYWRWQTTAFGIFLGLWLLVYLWGIRFAHLRTPWVLLQDLRRK